MFGLFFFLPHIPCKSQVLDRRSGGGGFRHSRLFANGICPDVSGFSRYFSSVVMLLLSLLLVGLGICGCAKRPKAPQKLEEVTHVRPFLSFFSCVLCLVACLEIHSSRTKEDKSPKHNLPKHVTLSQGTVGRLANHNTWLWPTSAPIPRVAGGRKANTKFVASFVLSP